jgi:L-cystine uptake protein TcyP (sodium:dicarboxylate symporter family)
MFTFTEDKKKIIGVIFAILLCLPLLTCKADLEDPYINDLRTPIENVFNIVVSVVGIVLVAVLAYGIWKSSMSLGDPRGLEGAKQTWTYALFGFAVIVLFFVIFSFLTGIFGIEVLTSPKTILEKVFNAIGDLFDLPEQYSSN